MSSRCFSRLLAFPAILLLAGCATVAPAGDASNGLQLYTVRAAMERDPHGTLRRVATLGYDEVEFAGTFGADPAGLCREAKGLGLRVGASHADWKVLRDDPGKAITEAKALCADTVLLAWLPPEERATLDQWRWWIGHLNEIASLAEAKGLKVAYHAHDFEFARIDGTRPIDMLMRDLDPAMGFELDTYWVAKAGEDPVAFLRRHADRVTLLHLKDIAPDGTMADLGAGTLDFGNILATARAQGIRHWFVERDDAPDPWASAAASLAHLRMIELGGR